MLLVCGLFGLLPRPEDPDLVYALKDPCLFGSWRGTHQILNIWDTATVTVRNQINNSISAKCCVSFFGQYISNLDRLGQW